MQINVVIEDDAADRLTELNLINKLDNLHQEYLELSELEELEEYQEEDLADVVRYIIGIKNTLKYIMPPNEHHNLLKYTL